MNKGTRRKGIVLVAVTFSLDLFIILLHRINPGHHISSITKSLKGDIQKSKKPSHFGEEENLSFLLPCDDGPYIWDKSEHLDGIGSTLQWRKQSFIASHIINGKWIGDLTNSHYMEEGDQSYYFGLKYSDCDESSLKIYTHLFPLHFIDIPRTNLLKYIPTLSVNTRTVLVFKCGYMEEEYNYMVFDALFRERFHKARALRTSLKRDINEYWVSIHFRWGDVQTKDVDQPNIRTGLKFSHYCKCALEIQSLKPNAIIFIFAEKLRNVKKICPGLNPNTTHHFSDSQYWRRDMDIMSQSNLLIGGSSSFFVLGAHLCQNCTVVHGSVPKFQMSKYEKTLPSHIKAFHCKRSLVCYLERIREHLR